MVYKHQIFLQSLNFLINQLLIFMNFPYLSFEVPSPVDVSKHRRVSQSKDAVGSRNWEIKLLRFSMLLPDESS